jgi:hypothetical protein
MVVSNAGVREPEQLACGGEQTRGDDGSASASASAQTALPEDVGVKRAFKE